MYLEAAGEIRIDAQRCLNRLYRGVECRTCLEQCPAKALSAGPEGIYLEGDACSGCGVCLTHCPTEVFRLEQWDEKLLVERAVQGKAGTAVLFCGRHPSPYRKEKDHTYDCFQVPVCLAGLSKAALFEIAAHKKVELMLDACGSCEWGDLSGLVRDQAQRVCEMLCACRGRGDFFLVEKRPDGEKGRKKKAVPSGERACSRREIIFRLADAGLRTVASSEKPRTEPPRQKKPAVNGVRTGRKLCYRPGWAERLKTAYRHMYESESVHGEPASFPAVRIRRNCTNCNLCASFCPTGALRIEAEEDSAAHYFQPMLCADCRLCAEVCPMEAVVRDRIPTERPFVTQIICRGPAVPCKKCGALTYNVTSGFCYWCGSEAPVEDIKAAVRKKLGNTRS
jgi:ferredoxin